MTSFVPVHGNEKRELSQEALSVLACPLCRKSLAVSNSTTMCNGCGTEFPRRNGHQLDLRLPGARQYLVEFSVGGSTTSTHLTGEPIPPNPNPSIDYNSVPLPPLLTRGNRLTRNLLSYFPFASKGGLMLDLGCGGEPFREISGITNLEYVGIDHDGEWPLLLGDAHSLPFVDNSFSFAISFAVLEHIRNPFIATREIFRVLKPGAMFIGSVAFLEPFHLNSYFHPTHLGTQYVLESSGFEVVHLEPNAEWSGLSAQAQMSLFPHLPAILSRVLISPLKLAHRVWWKLGHLLQRRSGTSERSRRLANTAGFRFVCRKPAEPHVNSDQ